MGPTLRENCIFLSSLCWQKSTTERTSKLQPLQWYNKPAVTMELFIFMPWLLHGQVRAKDTDKFRDIRIVHVIVCRCCSLKFPGSRRTRMNSRETEKAETRWQQNLKLNEWTPRTIRIYATHTTQCAPPTSIPYMANDNSDDSEILDTLQKKFIYHLNE